MLTRLTAVAICTLSVGAPLLQAQDRVVDLAVAGRSNAHPSIAANGTFVAVAWSAATTNAMDIFVAASRDGGRTFSTPTQVNAIAGDARVSGEQPPRVALVARVGTTPDIVVVWTTKNGANWKLLSARSTDAGRRFGANTPVPGSDAAGGRGWESVAVDDKGHVNVLWLDHRDLVSATPMPKHEMGSAAKADPTERAGLSQLYFSSLDATAPVSVTRNVCYCCKTSMVTSGHDVLAVWRHVYPGSYRDMAFAISHDRGRTFAAPIRVSEDHWQIDGCPDNGPSLAIDKSKRTHVVWPTSVDGKNAAALGVFYAMSRDGRTFTARTPLPSHGSASHPNIVIGADGAPFIAWDEIVDGARQLGLARVQLDATGKASFVALTRPDRRTGGQWYPVLAATNAGVAAAWVRQSEQGSVIGVGVVRSSDVPISAGTVAPPQRKSWER